MADLSTELASLRIDRSTPRTSGGGSSGRFVAKLLTWGGGLAGLVFAGIYGVDYAETRLFKASVRVTEVLEVSPAQAEVELTSTGYVVPQRVSKVGSKAQGRIASVAVREGDTVHAGQVIATLEDGDQRAALGTARARVATARARVQTARAALQEVQTQAEREQRLASRGAAPEATATDLAARVSVLRLQEKAAEAEVTAAEAEAEALRVTLGNTSIVAPIDGRVVGKPIQAGELVGGLNQGIIAELVDFASLRVETDVPENRLHKVKPDAPCEIVLDAFPTKRFRGKVVEVSPRVNRAKATVTVKVAFVDDPEGVLPDMAARVGFLVSELNAEKLAAPAKTVVPKSAVTKRAGADVVFQIEDGAVRLRTVTLGPELGNGYELVDGPRPGTRLVREPSEALFDGQKIKEEERT